MESSMLFITERMPFKQSHFQMYFLYQTQVSSVKKNF
jgi:hypothetical protein